MPLTYTQALLRVRNREAYPVAQVAEAASFILGTLDASDEDVSEAAYAAAFCEADAFVVAIEGASILGAIERGETLNPEAA